MNGPRSLPEISADFGVLADSFPENEDVKGYWRRVDALCSELTAHHLPESEHLFDLMQTGRICPSPGVAALLSARTAQGLLTSVTRRLELAAWLDPHHIVLNWAIHRGSFARNPMELYDAIFALYGLANALTQGGRENGGEVPTYGRVVELDGEVLPCFLPALSPSGLFDLAFWQFRSFPRDQAIQRGTVFEITYQIGASGGVVFGEASPFSVSWLAGFGLLAMALEPARRTATKTVFVRVIEVDGEGARFLAPELDRQPIELAAFPPDVSPGQMYVVRTARTSDGGWQLDQGSRRWIPVRDGIVMSCLHGLWEHLEERIDSSRRGEKRLPTLSIDALILAELERSAS